MDVVISGLRYYMINVVNYLMKIRWKPLLRQIRRTRNYSSWKLISRKLSNWLMISSSRSSKKRGRQMAWMQKILSFWRFLLTNGKLAISVWPHGPRTASTYYFLFIYWFVYSFTMLVIVQILRGDDRCNRRRWSRSRDLRRVQKHRCHYAQSVKVCRKEASFRLGRSEIKVRIKFLEDCDL